MSRIVLDFDLLPGVADSLLQSLETALKSLGGSLPRQLQQPADPELRLIWEAELKQAFETDASTLLRVLKDPEFGRSGYSLEETHADSLVRACSGLRLALRSSVLGAISDADLEAGEIHPAQFPPAQGEGVLCYWFLGALQELIVSALDPSSPYLPDSDEGESFGPGNHHSV